MGETKMRNTPESILERNAKIEWGLLSEEQRREFLTWATAGHDDRDLDALLDCCGLRGERRVLALNRYCDKLQEIREGLPREGGRAMKKIVNGKSYNTSTATEVCDIGNGLRKGDFKWDDSALYVTKKGAYFLAGEGGPSSRWAQEYSNMRIGGRGIRPLSKREALSLAEEHAPIDVIEEFFGDMIEEG